jgi:hypothetical protein
VVELTAYAGRSQADSFFTLRPVDAAQGFA